MDSEFFVSRVNDTALISQRTSLPKFLGFLTPSETETAEALLKKQGVSHSFFGGYESAERTVLCCKPDWCDEANFPITAFTLKYRNCDKLSHRDFLGAFMSLGITRESVGDILVEDGRAVAFVLKDISDYILTRINKIGNVGVEIKTGYDLPLPSLSKKVSLTDTVASNRLDCVVSAICGVSRKSALQYIADGIVSVNSVGCQKPTRSVFSGDRITVRGKGRFNIEDTDGVSKKGRIILKYSKYI